MLVPLGEFCCCAWTLVFTAGPPPAVADWSTVPDTLGTAKVMSGDPEVIDPPEITTVVEVAASVVSPVGGWAVMTQVPSERSKP